MVRPSPCTTGGLERSFWSSRWCKELKFLRHMAEEEEELIILLQNSNQYLETSCGNLETNSQVLNQIHTDSER